MEHVSQRSRLNNLPPQRLKPNISSMTFFHWILNQTDARNCSERWAGSMGWESQAFLSNLNWFEAMEVEIGIYRLRKRSHPVESRFSNLCHGMINPIFLFLAWKRMRGPNIYRTIWKKVGIYEVFAKLGASRSLPFLLLLCRKHQLLFIPCSGGGLFKRKQQILLLFQSINGV